MRASPSELHCWGGLGSQLYALSYLLELKSQKIDRDIVLIFHTGGVALRDARFAAITHPGCIRSKM